MEEIEKEKKKENEWAGNNKFTENQGKEREER